MSRGCSFSSGEVVDAAITDWMTPLGNTQDRNAKNLFISIYATYNPTLIHSVPSLTTGP